MPRTTSPLLLSRQFRYVAERNLMVGRAADFDNAEEVFSGPVVRVRSSSSAAVVRFNRVGHGRYRSESGKPVYLQILDLPEPTMPVPPSRSHKASEPPSRIAALLSGEEAKANRAGSSGEHVIVVARAGTGKTTTIVSGLRRMRGEDPGIIPSPQQQAVWDAMESSRGARFVAFVAFNRSIAAELKRRVPPGVDAKTNHGLGLSAVTKAFGRVAVVSNGPERTQNIMEELLGVDIRTLRQARPEFVTAVVRLVSLCKMNLTDAEDPAALMGLIDTYEVELDEQSEADPAPLLALIPRVLERAKDVRKDNLIDFDDMIWLPVALDLRVFRYDLLLVDEAQDLNRCQQALLRKAGQRLILIGDPKQAIYGFAGADSGAMPRMKRELEKDGRGVVELPLTVTRRCGAAIVEEARKIVPDFSAHESNPPGAVLTSRMTSEVPEREYFTYAKDGDMVLCRTNAPLVGQAFRFLKDGRKATIIGRDLGQGLIRLVKKLMKGFDPAKAREADSDTTEIGELRKRLGAWLSAGLAEENAKKSPSESKLVSLSDKYDCLVLFCEGAKTTQDVVRKIEDIFSEEAGEGVRLSSIHKAKGLEADRVFLLEPKGATVPHPAARSARAYESEMNLRYVAITRAIHTLYFVTD